MSVSKINGVTWSGISKVNGVAKANVARVISCLVTAGGGGGGGSVSTKSVVYDGVYATTLITNQHTFSTILYRSAYDKATISIWVNLDGVTDTTEQNIYASSFVNGPIATRDFLRIKRTSTNNPANVVVFANNASIDDKNSVHNAAFWKQVQAPSVAMDEWIHVCLVCKQASGGTGYDATIFVNGSSASDTSTTNPSTATNNLVYNRDAGLGSDYSPVNTTFVAFEEMKLSDYIVWSNELTSSEITEIYNAGVGGFDPSTNSGNYASSADLKIHYEVGNTAEDTTEAPVTNNTGTSGNLVHTNVEFASL